jgi:hypothetical protein
MMQRRGRVLTDITHGGEVVLDESVPALPAAGAHGPVGAAAVAGNGDAGAAVEAMIAGATAVEEVTFETPFGYLFPDLTDKPEAHLPADDPAKIVAGLKALGDAMVEDSLEPGEDPLQPTANSTIPPVYTYWGQFIDHDLTANTDRDGIVSDIKKPDLAPIAPDDVVTKLFNLRQPTLNLDSVYGDGPSFNIFSPTEAASLYDGIKFRIGKVAATALPGKPPIGGMTIPGLVSDDPNRDLPRIGALISERVLKETDFPEETRSKKNFRQMALIADARNDENLIISQLHLAFLRFHNAIVDWMKANDPAFPRSKPQQFARARQLARFHYQWLVVNDFLKTIALPGVVDRVLLGGPKHYKPSGEPFMPLEFSVAAYRFGHTMVRAAYDYNRNFGRPVQGPPPVSVVQPNASFDLLFTFTGGGFPAPFFGGTDVLPFNWVIEWDRFVDKGSATPDHFARKIDTRLAPPLKDMRNQGNGAVAPIKEILKRLARRNLLRGYLLSIPTGQSVAEVLGATPLTPDELKAGNSGPLNQVLEEQGFLDRTPLWYYILKEAQVRANGNSLGEVGSLIVCETIIGQLRLDSESYLNHKGGWDPSKGVKLAKAGVPNQDLLVTIGDLIRFAGIPS